MRSSPLMLGLSKDNLRTIRRLARQEILVRVSGTQLGILYYFVIPLFMLCIYSWAFSQVFATRWGGIGEAGFGQYALHLFAGLIPFQFFSEVVSRSPGLVLAYPSYVKKVVFPLETLVPISMGTAAMTALFSYAIFFVALTILSSHSIGWSALYLPLLWVPLVLYTASLSWILSALGVFLRDISQLCGVFISALMFLTPVFYPLELVPPHYRQLILLNPLAFLIEEMRNCLFGGAALHPIALLLHTLAALIAAQLGCGLFMRAKKAFADVM